MAEVKLPSNSDKFSEGHPVVEKGIEGTVHVKKKSELSKVGKEIFNRNAKDVWNYIWHDILLQSGKKMLEDMIVNGISMALWGETRPSNRSSSYRDSGSRTSYRDYYDQKSAAYHRPSRVVYGYDVKELEFTSERDAISVLDYMDECIHRSGYALVADYYQYSGEGTVSTDFDFGWSNLNRVSIVHTRDNYYIIDLPKPMPIEKGDRYYGR